MFSLKAEDPSVKKRSRIKAFCAAALLRCLMRVFGFTYRVKFEEGAHRAQELLHRKDPVVLCAWHNQTFFMGNFIESRLTRKGFNVAQMVSLSRDGDIGYLLGKWAGMRVVRGSSNRGGSKALRSLFRVIQNDRCSVVILPDGSQGPVYRAKAGAVVLAQLTRVPIYMFSYEADRCWRVKSWDRLIIPKPFARITVRMPEPMYVPRELSTVQMEEQRIKLENTLNELRRSD